MILKNTQFVWDMANNDISSMDNIECIINEDYKNGQMVKISQQKI